MTCTRTFSSLGNSSLMMTMRSFLDLLILCSFTFRIGAEHIKSTGCSSEHRNISELPSIIEKQGRRASIWYPPRYNDATPVPVIIAFHDTDQSVKSFARFTQLTNNTLNDFAIVVYPHRPENGWLSEEQHGNHSLTSVQQANDGKTIDDISWTIALLDHLERSFCIDPSRLYVSGLGSGGGLSHLLACHEGVNSRIAAFAAVNAALFKSNDFADDSIWATCNTGRQQLPTMEIHSSANSRHRYYPKKGEKGLRLPDWLALWSKQNGCGGIDGPTVPSSWSNATYVTKLKNGQMSEGNVNGGGVTRVSYRCRRESLEQESDVETTEAQSAVELDEGSSIPAWYHETPAVWQPEADELDEGSTILHYNLQGLAHGWPRQEIRHSGVVVVDGIEVRPPGKPYFDTTAVMLKWMRSHSLSDSPSMIPAEVPAQSMSSERDEL